MTKYYHVDVFSNKILSGNGLSVLFLEENLETKLLLQLAQEFRQFETIFLHPVDTFTFDARIFTMEEELPFAGHPILGAGASIHKEFFSSQHEIDLTLKLGQRNVEVKSVKKQTYYTVSTDQGAPIFLGELDKEEYRNITDFLNIDLSDLSSELPIEVISTGLPYLLVPTIRNLDKSKITKPGFENILAKYEAKFVYVFDITTLEARTWDNSGNVEDIATGSAAGPLCAYLVKHKIKQPGTKIEISQGQFVNRPSIISTEYVVKKDKQVHIFIKGDVAIFSHGLTNLSY